MTKTCGECKHFDPKYKFCSDDFYPLEADDNACGAFEPKPKNTNGDKIIAGGMRAIAELGFGNPCARCIYSTYEEDVGFGEAGWTCNHPKDKDCVDGIEAWLNAPAESDGGDE